VVACAGWPQQVLMVEVMLWEAVFVVLWWQVLEVDA
jgi:hypothetical protein